MWLDIGIFITFWVGLHIFNVYTMGSSNYTEVYNIMTKSLLFTFVVSIPFNEEVVFRYFLIDMFGSFEYYKYLNAVLFGLVHGTNYLFVNDRKRIIYQVIATTIFGFLLIDKPIHVCILAHMFHNSIGIIIGYIMTKYGCNKSEHKWTTGRYVDENNKVFESARIVKLTRSRSDNALDKYIEWRDFKIDKDSEILKSIDRYNSVVSKRTCCIGRIVRID